MAEERVQTYENHVRHDKVVYTVLAIYLIVLIVAVAGIITDNPRVVGVAVVLAVVGGLLAAVNSRTYATKLQDRIVRLEMRLHLRQVLPDELAADVMEFKLSQLVALRFASDDELPELARKVLDENITKGSDIKKMIRDWQADWHRV